ncbi:hypothetical protein [Corynebacterium cystitidis]|uniref:hypothetical protein n=1 Tax=Corynebacterium cystitidis TaxID=35757 RepID=UPI00211E21D8|nr:hypothetical protein [Corynebacterium cystitidis]
MPRLWRLYGLAITIIVGPFGYVAVIVPVQIAAATPGFLTAALMVVLFAIVVPPAQLAFVGKPVPADSQIPFSQSLAQRIAGLLDSQRTMMAWLAVFLSAATSFSTLVSVLPGWQRYETAAEVIGGVGTVVVALGLVVKVFMDHDRLRKTIPADEDEKKRNHELRNHSGLGLIKNPADPMVLLQVPATPTNINVNLAHPEGQRAAWFGFGALVVFLVAVIALAAM